MGIKSGRRLYFAGLHADANEILQFLLSDGGWVLDGRSQSTTTKNYALNFEDQATQFFRIWLGHALVAPNRGYHRIADITEQQTLTSISITLTFGLDFNGIVRQEGKEVLYLSSISINPLFLDDLEERWKRFGRWIKGRFARRKTTDIQKPYVTNPTFLVGPAAAEWESENAGRFILGCWPLLPVPGLDCWIQRVSARGPQGT
jgi:hypothetical protein